MIEQIIESLLFASRRLLAPIYLLHLFHYRLPTTQVLPQYRKT
jgi:uncharacterized membrane protein YqhA